MAESLFEACSGNEDPMYIKVCTIENEYVAQFRKTAAKLWIKYRPYADPDYREQLKMDFDARFWEMYLTCTLLDLNLPVQKKKAKQGPDILIQTTNKIWFEAIAPSPGDNTSCDRVPDLVLNNISKMPEDQIILRYLSSIKEKYDNKYYQYLNEGIISPSDSYVIAINSCKIEAALVDTSLPRICKTVFPFGYRQITVNTSSKAVIKDGYQARFNILKTSGAQIPTTIFIDPKYERLSGILYSHSGIRKIYEHNEDFIFIHNPLAINPVEHGLIKLGTEYMAIDDNNSSYTLTSKEW